MRRVTNCQICGGVNLRHVLSLGHMPPVNQLTKIGELDERTNWLPTDLLHCTDCQLVQLGVIADKETVFPSDYPYTSGTTKLLRDNFTDLAKECCSMGLLKHNDLVVDIGSNDGTLLSNFQNYDVRVTGVEPTDVAKVAQARGIATMQEFFDAGSADSMKGEAKVVTMTNCFAHIDNVHDVVENVKTVLTDDGTFITESHYLVPMLQQTQFDAIYHEHLRYYSLRSLRHLFAMHNMEIFHSKLIPTHGGSIRVYARKGNQWPVIEDGENFLWTQMLDEFAARTKRLKLSLLEEIVSLRARGYSIAGISCPSRASTLIHYLGLDEDLVDKIYEISGSLKIGRYAPGTRIPIVDEVELMIDKPQVAILLSWHIADTLRAALRKRGYAGEFIQPLPFERLKDEAA